MARLRRTLVILICTVVTGGLAAVAIVDPLHLRYARWFTSGLVLLTLLLLTAMLAVLAPHGLLRVLALVIGGSAVVGWCGIVWFASQLETASREISEVRDGAMRLLVIEASELPTDPVYAVVLRSGSGPFEQEALVYQGLPEIPQPSGVRFVDGGTVEVLVGASCRYRSTVEQATLAVQPVHRPLRAGTC